MWSRSAGPPLHVIAIFRTTVSLLRVIIEPILAQFNAHCCSQSRSDTSTVLFGRLPHLSIQDSSSRMPGPWDLTIASSSEKTTSRSDDGIGG